MSGRFDNMKGIIPALITPYNGNGEINEPVTRALVRHLMAKGIAGFYLSGSTGEGFLQSVEERKQFLEIVLDEVNGALPVIAQIGAMDTRTCTELAKHAAQAGASAVSAVAPFYYKHGLEQIKRHYLDIVEAADIPLIIYHFPDFTGAKASIEFYRELSKIESVIGLKFTAKDMFEMQQLIEACGEDFLVFNGPDECCLAGLVTGACGAIGSTYNIMPEKFVTLYNHVQNGRLAEARAIQYEVNGLIRELLKYDFIAFEREILRLQGFEVGNGRKPIQQLTDKDRKHIRGIAEKFPFLEIR